jgi:hypothetical protein
MDRPVAVVRFLDGVVDHIQYRADGRVLDYALRARFAVDYGGETYGDRAQAAELRVTREPRGAAHHREITTTAPELPGVQFRADDFVPLAVELERIVLLHLAGFIASASGRKPLRVEGLALELSELRAELPVEPDV